MSGYEENKINSGYVERANLHQVEQESKAKNSKKKKKNIRITGLLSQGVNGP